MQSLKRKQQGFTVWQMAIYICMLGLVLTSVMKLGPHYVDDNSVASAIKGVHESLQGKDIYEVENAAIKSSMGKFFDVSMVPGVILDQIQIKRENGKVLLIVNYDISEPFIGNIDAVMHFKHEVDLAAPLSQ